MRHNPAVEQFRVGEVAAFPAPGFRIRVPDFGLAIENCFHGLQPSWPATKRRGAISCTDSGAGPTVPALERRWDCCRTRSATAHKKGERALSWVAIKRRD